MHPACGIVCYNLLDELGSITSHVIQKAFGEDIYRVIIGGRDTILLIHKKQVICIHGTIVTRRFDFDDDIMDCFYTTFNSGDKEAKLRSLVIVFRDQIRVYNNKGSSKIVTLPFHIKRAFPFQNGIVINKEFNNFPTESSSASLNEIPTTVKSAPSSTSTPVPTIMASVSTNESNFLTLLDPLGDPGMITSSSVTSFSSKEELMFFPSHSNYCLASLFNPLEYRVNIYHVRYLSNAKISTNKKSATYLGLRKASSRTASSSTGLQPLTPSTSRILEDDSKQIRSCSTLSHDRMASNTEGNIDSNITGRSFNGTFASQKLRKDIIFTKMNSIPMKASTKHLKIFNLLYQDQEAVVIRNKKNNTVMFLVYDNPANIVSLPVLKNKIILSAIDATSLNGCKNHSGYVVLQNSTQSIKLYNPFMGITSPNIRLSKVPSIESIDGFYDSTLLLEGIDKKHYSVNLCIKPVNSLTSTMLKCFKYIANSYLYEYFWLNWCSIKSMDIQHVDDWTIFITTLLSLTTLQKTVKLSDVNKNEITRLLPFARNAFKMRHSNDSFNETNNHDYCLDSLLPIVVLAAHLIREDLRLNVLASTSVGRLSIFLAQFVSWLGWSDNWFKYYMINDDCIDRQTKLSTSQPLSVPPNLFESLSSLFTGSIVSYITFSQIVEEDESIDELIIPRTFYILRLFEVLISSQYVAEDLVRMMADYNIKQLDLETFPAGIYIILMNAITVCRGRIKSRWSLGDNELELIGRKDLLNFNKSSEEAMISSQISSKNFKLEGGKEMSQVLKYVNNHDALSPWDDQAEADKFRVTRLIFSKDRRFYEVTRLLQTSKVQTGFLKLPSSMDENEKLTKQRALGAKLALRTLVMPIGRAAVFISSRRPLVTEKFPIPKMNFNALILPDMINVGLEKDSIDPYLYDWGYFHNGVSAGLMTSRSCKDINGSWIAFNRPQNLNAQHAGFLLGLGLNGHLRHLEEWHIYNYLGPKHNFTSIGLLLGMAASLRGTMNVKLTKVLSVHVVALLPPGSTDLNVQLPVQTAGLLGIGLLYLNSGHRRMTDMLLSQITSVLTINEHKIMNEGYRLAAGIALGYVNLGKGESLKDGTDTHVIDRLISLATLVRDVETSKELDKSCGGALMALMMIFLRSNDTDIAVKLQIPHTRQLLDYMRPDLLLLRCLAKNLVMWDSVGSTQAWVESQIPKCIGDSFHLEGMRKLDSEILPYLNVLGGALLAMAIRHASSANANAKATIIHYSDHLMTLCSQIPSNYDERIALIGARNVRDVVFLGLSIVMAGTGDLDTLRRLRYLQGITDHYTNYGDYLAINMALGFLFLGGGQQSFRTSDDFSLAAIITSVYPVFSNNNYECTSECSEVLLQAFRHFWAMAVENRCLVVRDVITKQPVKVDVDLETIDFAKHHLLSPCLLPEFERIRKISVCVDQERNTNEQQPNNPEKYFTVTLDFGSADKKQIEKFRKNLTIFVYEKPQFQDLKLTFDAMTTVERTAQEIESPIDTKPKELLKCFEGLSIFKGLKLYEKNILFRSNKTLNDSSVLDLKIEVENMFDCKDPNKLWNLKLLFNYIDHYKIRGRLDRDKSRIDRRFKLRNYLSRNRQINSSNLGNVQIGFDGSLVDDTFESKNKVDQEEQQEDLSYLNIKFIEKLRNALFREIKGW